MLLIPTEGAEPFDPGVDRFFVLFLEIFKAAGTSAGHWHICLDINTISEEWLIVNMHVSVFQKVGEHMYISGVTVNTYFYKWKKNYA